MPVAADKKNGSRERLILSIRKMHHLYDQYSKLLEERSGLTAAQLACLTALSSNGALPAGKISELIMLDPSTLTGVVDRLVRRGLVKRHHDAEDRRVWKIQITTAGRKVVEEAPPTLQRRLAGSLSHLPKSERARIVACLEQVAEWMEVINETV